VAANGWTGLPADLVSEVLDELNVQTVTTLDGSDSSLVQSAVKANFRELGKRFGKTTPAVAAAIAAADPDELVAALRERGNAQVEVDGDKHVIGEDDVVITETPREGWAVSTDSGETIALDLTLTPELVAIGLARDVIREIQEARKKSGLEVTDRITLQWNADDEVSAAIATHQSEIADEVLATTIEQVEGQGAQEILNGRATITVAKA